MAWDSNLTVKVQSMNDGSNRGLWLLPWDVTEHVDQTSFGPPPDPESAAVSDTGYPYWYLPVDTGIEEMFNILLYRNPLWNVNNGSGGTAPHIKIKPWGSVSIPEPINIGFDGGDGFLPTAPVNEVIVGDRSFFIKNEQEMEGGNPGQPSAGIGSFQYTANVNLQHPAGGGTGDATIDLEYSFKLMPYLAIGYGNKQYYPGVHKYKWSYLDDAGSCQGGFITHFADLPAGGEFMDATMSTIFRLAKVYENNPDPVTGRKIPNRSEHKGVGFTAYGFNTLGVDLVNRTDTEILDNELELEGRLVKGNVWIQPKTTPSGITYFGYRIKTTDPSSSLWLEDTGYLRSKNGLPLTMTPRIARAMMA